MSRLKFKICHLSRCWPSLRSTLNTRTYSQAIKRPSKRPWCWISASKISSLSSSKVPDFRRTTKSLSIRGRTRLTQMKSNKSLMTKASSIKTLWRILWLLWKMARFSTATISRTHLSSASTIRTKWSFRGTTASSEITRRMKRKTTLQKSRQMCSFKPNLCSLFSSAFWKHYTLSWVEKLTLSNASCLRSKTSKRWRQTSTSHSSRNSIESASLS